MEWENASSKEVLGDYISLPKWQKNQTGDGAI